MKSIDVRAGSRAFMYFDMACAYANSMLNVTNFYIRTLMTGLKKEPPQRTLNERDVIETVNSSIPEVNRILEEKYSSRVKKVMEREIGYLYGTVKTMRHDDILAESRRYHRMATGSAETVPA